MQLRRGEPNKQFIGGPRLLRRQLSPDQVRIDTLKPGETAIIVTRGDFRGMLVLKTWKLNEFVVLWNDGGSQIGNVLTTLGDKYVLDVVKVRVLELIYEDPRPVFKDDGTTDTKVTTGDECEFCGQSLKETTNG